MSGAAFAELAAAWEGCSGLHLYSRQRQGFTALDLEHAEDLPLPSGTQPSVLVSFAPIWLFAPFLKRWLSRQPHQAYGIAAVLACSSSSVLTKRFAFNAYDRNLVAGLSQAEECLLATCKPHNIPCGLIQPTLIYGQLGTRRDANLSRLLGLMSRWPLLPLPANTGLRQPIHACQLAAVVLQLITQLGNSAPDRALTERVAVGGDQALTYTAMLEALKLALPAAHPARRCHLFPIPNRLFFLLSAPLLLVSPKNFEAVLRMAADLAGFTSSHQLLGQPAKPFPVLPLAL